MASQQDLQELLRLLTGTRKLPMLLAMNQVKSLQNVGLRSIQQIADASLADVEKGVPDAKAARSLHNACKAVIKRGDSATKRPAPGSEPPSSSASKRPRLGDGTEAGGGSNSAMLFGVPAQMTPRELEASLALPVDTDEARIAAAPPLQTNRAPLVLAFAVELLRYTMPEQPPSSRLSLAQAVVSANSRTKAVSLGLEKTPAAEREGWGEGQPKLRVMGREISVLKRGGYQWEGEEVVDDDDDEKTMVSSGDTNTATVQSEKEDDAVSISSENEQTHIEPTQQTKPAPAASQQPPKLLNWSTSQSISLKSSTFVARATHMPDPTQRKKLLSSLMERYPNLRSATHNAWAYRARPPGSGRILEDSFDDGETGCGDLMLRVMRESDAVDCLVVLTRWFGGIMLGPDRWRLMRNCVRGALAERMRLTGAEAADLGGEAVWGLDLETMRGKATAGPAASASGRRFETTVVGMQIHRPEAARNYLLRSFVTAEEPTQATKATTAADEEEDDDGREKKAAKTTTPKKKKMTQKAIDAEKEQNLGLLLGALRLLYDSWADHLTAADLDRRAWSWYTAVRPDVDSGPSGWGAKGKLRLQSILDLRRKAP